MTYYDPITHYIFVMRIADMQYQNKPGLALNLASPTCPGTAAGIFFTHPLGDSSLLISPGALTKNGAAASCHRTQCRAGHGRGINTNAISPPSKLQFWQMWEVFESYS